MFGIGETELLIIVAFGFMIFGPDKLPGMGRTIGRALRQFRQAQEGFTEVVQSEVMDPLQQAMGDPLDAGTRQQRRTSAEERAAALAQDADIDAPTGTTEHKETFAERKARLAAERKAREEQAAASTESDEVAGQPAPAEAEAEAGAGVEEAPATDTSAASLYALGGRSAYGAARQQEADEAAPADKKEDTTDEKEAGSAQA